MPPSSPDVADIFPLASSWANTPLARYGHATGTLLVRYWCATGILMVCYWYATDMLLLLLLCYATGL